MMFLILGLTAILDVITFFVYGIDNPFLTIFAGVGASLALTASLAKVENDAPDNWPVAIQSSLLFVLYFVPIAYSNVLLTPEYKTYAWFILICWFVPPLVYLGKPSHNLWPMSLAMAWICAFPGGILRWGFYYSARMEDWYTSLGGVALSLVTTAVLIYMVIRVTELLADVGLSFISCKNAGSLRFIARGDKLKFMVANRDGVVRDPARRMPPVEMLDDGNFIAIREWKEGQGITDPICECVDFLLFFPGIYWVPLLAKERKLKHPFIKVAHVDVDHGDHADDHDPAIDLNPVSCTLLFVPDTDIRKPASLGQTGKAMDVTVGCEIRVCSPSALFGSHHWAHNVDHSWEALVSALGNRQGANLIGYQGPIAELYEARPPFGETFLSVATGEIPGTPALEDDFEHFEETLLEVGIIPAEAELVIVKAEALSDVVRAAQDLFLKTQTQRVLAPMQAETMQLVQSAQFQGLVNALDGTTLDDTQRAEILGRAATFMFMGDSNGLASMMSQMGIMGAAFGQGRAAAAPPSGGGGRGGGGTPPAGGAGH